ncbi:MAG: hypothetical protein Kow0089_18750 [Desulfobulbaceae bacterium]
MARIDEKDLSALLQEKANLRLVEPGIYSVLPNNESGNEYDTFFGVFYDIVACNPIYNRLIWGYSVKAFQKIAQDALYSSTEGMVLDLGCGALAFTANTYSNYKERPVVLSDQSLKMLRMAKKRIEKHRGSMPENLVFLHADALDLPFKENSFETILSENLLHCLSDTSILLEGLKKIKTESGKLFFTTLIKNNRYSDRYLEALAEKGKIVPRSEEDHRKIFAECEMAAKYKSTGAMLSITY